MSHVFRYAISVLLVVGSDAVCADHERGESNRLIGKGLLEFDNAYAYAAHQKSGVEKGFCLEAQRYFQTICKKLLRYSTEKEAQASLKEFERRATEGNATATCVVPIENDLSGSELLVFDNECMVDCHEGMRIGGKTGFLTMLLLRHTTLQVGTELLVYSMHPNAPANLQKLFSRLMQCTLFYEEFRRHMNDEEPEYNAIEKHANTQKTDASLDAGA